MSHGKAKFEQPLAWPQTETQCSPGIQAISSGNNILANIPGTIIKNSGKTLSADAKRAPPCALVRFFADRVLWTISWSVHQYHIETALQPKIHGSHGEVGSFIGRSNLNETSLAFAWQCSISPLSRSDLYVSVKFVYAEFYFNRFLNPDLKVKQDWKI